MFWVEVVFMMFVLKIPVLAACWILWWAVRAEPRPLEGAALLAGDDPDPSRPRPASRRRPYAPRGGPARSYPRTARAAAARAGARR